MASTNNQLPPVVKPEPTEPRHDLKFTYDPSLESFNVTPKAWLTSNDKHWDGIASAALVFIKTTNQASNSNQLTPTTANQEGKDHLLLVQRAATDSMPNKWETPGGAVDNNGETILQGCIRELLEESSLRGKHIRRIVTEGEGVPPGTIFTNRTGVRVFCRFAFEVDVEADTLPRDDGKEVEVTGAGYRIVLDPNEHQDWAWVTEEALGEGKVGDRLIPLTHSSQWKQAMEGFRLRKSLVIGA